MADIVRSDLSRVFTIENAAGPSNVPKFQGFWRAGAASQDLGNITLVRVPDPNNRRKFIVIDKYTGEPGNPSLEITARYTMDLSDLLRISKKQCDIDLQIMMGLCGNPQDYKEGWDKILILENARATTWGTDQLGALGPDETSPVSETVPFEGSEMYEVKKLAIQNVARAEVLREVLDITICDAESCGSCGIPSDGCSVILGLMKSGAGSPGILAEIIYTKDGGATWGASTISTLAIGETPRRIACVGLNALVASPTSGGMQYTDLSDLVNGFNPTWVEVTTGIVASGQPRAIFSANPSYTWVVASGGYIYFTEDPTNAYVLQDSGGATTQDYNDVHGLDINYLVAVGNSNAVVFTTNGGKSWQALTGPAVGVNLNAVWMRSRSEWIVGAANGKLYYTRDAGSTWTEKTFPGSGSGNVTDVKFVTKSVGYMTHTTTAPAGRVLRTINGGYSWVAMPEGNTTLPSNQGMNSVAVCGDPNMMYAGGLASDGTDGIILKGAA